MPSRLHWTEDNDTYKVISVKEYKEKYSSVQVIPSMVVQVVKPDEDGNPDGAKSRIVALGNHEETEWTKADTFAPVLRDESCERLNIISSS